MQNSEQAKENQGNSSPRVVSLQRISLLLDRDRNTVAKWISHGLPIISAADKKLGRPTEIDVAAAVRWLEERAAEEAVGNLPVGGEGKEEADRRKAWAQAQLAELQLEEARKAVVRVDDVADLVATEYATVRSALESIPAKMASRLIGQTDPAIIQSAVEEAIRHALEGLRHDRPAA